MGSSWSPDIGDYDVGAVSANIGDNAINSIQIQPGYEVYACDGAGFQPKCDTYVADIPSIAIDNDLDGLYNAISSLRITYVGGAPLQITVQPAVLDILPTQAKVQWGLNEVGTGQVHYGTTSTLGQFNTKETSFNYSSHTQPLKNLQPGTTYYFKVVSENQAGQAVESGVKVFNTPSDGDATVNVANEEEIVYNTYLLEQNTATSCY
jgi:hypothetical protein